MTVEVCATNCDGFSYYGVENGNDCYCGNEVIGAATTTGCITQCPGNPNEICGGPNNKMNLYQK